MSWTFVQHVHTRHSVDCLTQPKALVRRAKALGVEVLAVTDHDTWKGSFESRLVARRLGLNLRVILATEPSTGSSPWRTHAVAFDVPADCPAQWLTLELDARIAAETQAMGTAWFDDVEVVSRGAGKVDLPKS